MQFFYQREVPQGHNYLTEEESRHCVKVLRRKLGDLIFVTDGLGNLYRTRITKADLKRCEFEIVDTRYTPRPEFHIHIAISPTKNLERTEWFVEKAVEIGVQEISFIATQNSERTVLKQDRIVRKAISAMKQSQKLYQPAINTLTTFDNFLGLNLINHNTYIANVDFENQHFLMQVAPPHARYCVLIGPEGDFSENEIELALDRGFHKVSLGNSRLRTETAGLVACHILNLINL